MEDRRRRAIESLGIIVRCLSRDRVTNRDGWKLWAKSHELQLQRQLWYEPFSDMPAANSLITISFNPHLPLVMFNYTQVAHNRLHAYPNGWTLPIRMCRGIVFELKTGKLIALPFMKFFNYGEHPETQLENLSDGYYGYCEGSEKADGHLGIIFQYEGNFYCTTRGQFTSPSARLGTEMLAKYVHDYSWQDLVSEEQTILVEIIAPETRVFTDYGDTREFRLIGMMNRTEFRDYSHQALMTWGRKLHLPVTPVVGFSSLEELTERMRDRSVHNQEGVVVRFENGLRVKFKYETYIGLMVADKLSYTYLMNRWMTGNVARMLLTLDEEIQKTARQMLGAIFLRVNAPAKNLKEIWWRLYSLLPPEDATSYFKQTCRKFVKHIAAEGLLVTEE